MSYVHLQTFSYNISFKRAHLGGGTKSIWPKDSAVRGLKAHIFMHESHAHSDVEEDNISEYENNTKINSEYSDSESDF